MQKTKTNLRMKDICLLLQVSIFNFLIYILPKRIYHGMRDLNGFIRKNLKATDLLKKTKLKKLQIHIWKL